MFDKTGPLGSLLSLDNSRAGMTSAGESTAGNASEQTDNDGETYGTRSIPVELIYAADNDRKSFAQSELVSLAESIRDHGLAQPPTVRPVGSRYEIVAGERRVRAIRDVLGLTSIPVMVRALDDSAAAAIMLAENMHRADLDPIEEASAYAGRMERFEATVAEVAEVANVPLFACSLPPRALVPGSRGASPGGDSTITAAFCGANGQARLRSPVTRHQGIRGGNADIRPVRLRLHAPTRRARSRVDIRFVAIPPGRGLCGRRRRGVRHIGANRQRCCRPCGNKGHRHPARGEAANSRRLALSRSHAGPALDRIGPTCLGLRGHCDLE